METRRQKTEDVRQFSCYHCGETCERGSVLSNDHKMFCCDGCLLVYDLLKENSLCTYYTLNANPGNSGASAVNKGRYDHLDEEAVSSRLICFRDGNTVHVNFYIPKIHCSSCIWLLENLHKLNNNVQSSVVNFVKKEVKIVFDISKVKLSQIVALCSNIGYEPLINLNSLDKQSVKPSSKSKVLKIGLAGFCFGNIMMLSFPEYFSFGSFLDKDLSRYFNYLNLLLSIPVILYCASDFFVSAIKSIRHKYLNIDAPIALAILVTFLRSVYEIISGAGTGYLDSMSGIVFFMLIGRYFQDRTYEALSFDHNYRSYFPVGVTVIKNNKEENRSVESLKKGDEILIRNAEIIPCDSILKSESTHIDYSFITGESRAIKKQKGDRIYAGGKQLGSAVTLEVDNIISKSYLTQLWNGSNRKQKQSNSFVDKLNKYFTIAVLIISLGSFLFWSLMDADFCLRLVSRMEIFCVY
ncbi:MAG: heavy metal translocating P-type ATPase [Bacteroidetes bacterium]|nr:heavy metal translocating P-type ATPase [Bacteroidota bacterium]